MSVAKEMEERIAAMESGAVFISSDFMILLASTIQMLFYLV